LDFAIDFAAEQWRENRLRLFFPLEHFIAWNLFYVVSPRLILLKTEKLLKVKK